MGQRYSCENKECGEDIGEEGKRYQCPGCLRWYCLGCTTAFPYVDGGVWTHTHVCYPCYWAYQCLCLL
jgi:hypothetical protein